MRRRFFSSSNSETNYCTLEALSDGLFQFESKEADVYYRLDRQGVFYKFNINHRSIPIKKGQVIELKGKNCTGNVGSIFTDASFNLSGNSLSLIFGDDYKNKYDISNYPYVFYSLFDNVNIVNVSSDFLPATILSTGCYSNMFEGCTSLVNAPELPSQDLVFNCYNNMFKGCTNLNYIKMLATDISASYCLNNWVSGVSTTGTFVKHPEATWNVRGVNGVPEGWTIKFDGEEEGGTYDEFFGQIPPESTSFDFPLYITVPFVESVGSNDRYYERQEDNLALQLREWFFENAEYTKGPWFCYYELYPDNIYINGVKVSKMDADLFDTETIEDIYVNIQLAHNNHGDINIGPEGFLCMVIYNI